MLSQMTLDMSKINRGNADRNGELALELVTSLDQRRAVPEIRVRYWKDPEFNTGRLKCSHREVFERNGCRGEDIFSHPHFLPYLRYFLFGSDLPSSVKDEFCKAAGNPSWLSGSDFVKLGKLARTLTRQHSIERRKSREEFFKLALDLTIHPMHAGHIRQAI